MKFRRGCFLVFVIMMMIGCSENKVTQGIDSLLIGSWSLEGSQEVTFVFYDDGTCEFSGEYGTGSWDLVNDNQLKVTSFYGESETVPIVSVDNQCLILGDTYNQVKYLKLQ